jgi:propanol-preferring alcohol dehydrogenase
MSDIPAFPYRLLWGERVLRSVANLTRDDGIRFFELAERAHVQTTTLTVPLADANHALTRLRRGDVTGALVLTP